MTTQLALPLATVKREWIDRSAMAFHRHKHALGDFTSDDLHWLCGLGDEPPQPNWWGCLMARLKAEGSIVEVGRKASQRIAANGRKVTVWRVCER